MRGQAEPLPFERMDKPWHIQGFTDQPNVADAHFLFLAVVLTPFLSISVCWFWFRLPQTTEAELGRDGSC